MDAMVQRHIAVTTVSTTHTWKMESVSATMDGDQMTAVCGQLNATQFVRRVPVLQSMTACTVWSMPRRMNTGYVSVITSGRETIVLIIHTKELVPCDVKPVMDLALLTVTSA